MEAVGPPAAQGEGGTGQTSEETSAGDSDSYTDSLQ
jgi:hypothetical protein